MPTVFSKLKLRSLSSQAAQSNISIDASGYVAQGVDKFDERKLPTLSVLDKSTSAISTSGDNSQASNNIISEEPKDESYVEVKVNGIEYEVGDAVKTKSCYFSGDGGTTAKSFSSSHANGKISKGDELYWNGSVAGFELVNGWRISISYLRSEYDQLAYSLSILQSSLNLALAELDVLNIELIEANQYLADSIASGNSNDIDDAQSSIQKTNDSIDEINAQIDELTIDIDSLQTIINTIP
jgi:hypothetical protein